LYIFKRTQTVIDLGEVRFGGQPGENPTVLVGGVFFRGQSIIKNPIKGTFDKEMLIRWIQEMEEMMVLTDHPSLLQIYGATPKAIINHIRWITDHWEGPFIFESIDSLTRMSAMEYVAKAGLQSRAIFNSINISTSPEELNKLRNCGIQAAIVLGWSPHTKNLDDRMNIIRNQISQCEKIGIKKIIVDPASLPIDVGYGLEWRTNIAIKSEMGYPISNGAYNAPSTWNFFKENKGDKVTRTAILTAAVTAAKLSCADLIFYGSLERMKEMFAAVAFIENGVVRSVAEALTTLGVRRTLFTPRL
jgi:tetrahydromethanopterin S-methyltransferase subunit H